MLRKIQACHLLPENTLVSGSLNYWHMQDLKCRLCRTTRWFQKQRLKCSVEGSPESGDETEVKSTNQTNAW